MEFSEALLLLRRRLLLFVLCAVVPTLAVLLTVAGRPMTYVAQARITTSDSVNKSTIEAEAKVATVRALATTPSIVARALDAADIRRNAAEVAENDVSVDLLGVSTVATVQLTDTDPQVAERGTNSLADTVVAHLAGLSCDRQAVLTALDAAISSRRQDRTAVEQRLSQLTIDNPLAAALRAREADLSAQLSRLEVERLDAASRRCGAGVSVLDRATSATELPDPVLHDLLLAGLLGIGVAGAGLALWEILRPSIGTALQLAQALRVPVLGVVTRHRGAVRRQDAQALLVKVCLAARQDGLERIVLAGGQDADDLLWLLVALQSAGPSEPPARARRSAFRLSWLGTTVEQEPSPARVLAEPSQEAAGAPVALPVPTFAVARLDGLLSNDWSTERTGVLIVAVSGQSRSSLSATSEFVALSGWPVVGGVLLQGRRRSL